MRGIADRTADEVAAEARAWLEEAMRGSPVLGRQRQETWCRTTVSVTPVSGDDQVHGWRILVVGPADPHNGGTGRTKEQAVSIVREGTRTTVEKAMETLRWLRSRGVVLREVADEAEVSDVMES